MPKKVILDVDTGSDDAVAIMAAIASPALEVVALCTVWGNLEVEDTTKNTLAVAEAMGAGDIPVYPGAATAICKYLTANRRLDQRDYAPIEKDGRELRIHYAELEGVPPPTGKPQATPAALFYVDYLLNATEPVTLVPVGPLTNLGLAFRLRPEIAKNVEEIVLMGGGADIGNSTLCSEANIWHDPEAAHIVLHCGAPVTFVPLDATHAASLTLEDCEKLESLGSFAGSFAARLTRGRIEYEAALFNDGRTATAVHDALAVCSLIDPQVLQDVRQVHCEIGFGDVCEGAVLVDGRRIPRAKGKARFAFGADHERFAQLLCTLFAKEG